MMEHGEHSATGSDERVGHCRPPKAHQFKKGRSGNPRGRPPKPKPRTMTEMISNALNEEIEVKIGGKVRRLTRREAIVERHVHDAMAGKKGAVQALDAISKMPVMMPPSPPDDGWITHTFHIDTLNEAIELIKREKSYDKAAAEAEAEAEAEAGARLADAPRSSDDGAVLVE